MTTTMASTTISPTINQVCIALDMHFGIGPSIEDNGYSVATTASYEISEAATNNGLTTSSSDVVSRHNEHDAVDDATFVIKRIFTPLFCGFGIVGNILNILVLTEKKDAIWVGLQLRKGSFYGTHCVSSLRSLLLHKCFSQGLCGESHILQVW